MEKENAKRALGHIGAASLPRELKITADEKKSYCRRPLGVGASFPGYSAAAFELK